MTISQWLLLTMPNNSNSPMIKPKVYRSSLSTASKSLLKTVLHYPNPLIKNSTEASRNSTLLAPSEPLSNKLFLKDFMIKLSIVPGKFLGSNFSWETWGTLFHMLIGPHLMTRLRFLASSTLQGRRRN